MEWLSVVFHWYIRIQERVQGFKSLRTDQTHKKFGGLKSSPFFYGVSDCVQGRVGCQESWQTYWPDTHWPKIICGNHGVVEWYIHSTTNNLFFQRPRVFEPSDLALSISTELIAKIKLNENYIGNWTHTKQGSPGVTIRCVYHSATPPYAICKCIQRLNFILTKTTLLMLNLCKPLKSKVASWNLDKGFRFAQKWKPLSSQGAFGIQQDGNGGMLLSPWYIWAGNTKTTNW